MCVSSRYAIAYLAMSVLDNTVLILAVLRPIYMPHCVCVVISQYSSLRRANEVTGMPVTSHGSHVRQHLTDTDFLQQRWLLVVRTLWSVSRPCVLLQAAVSFNPVAPAAVLQNSELAGELI